MTTEQKLSVLEGLCERAYGMGEVILDPNVTDMDEKVRAMVKVAGTFMGGYNAYKKRVGVKTKDFIKENGTN